MDHWVTQYILDYVSPVMELQFPRRCRAYELVCLAKGASSTDARAMLKYKDSPELYLEEFKASDQHFTSGLTHC